MINLRTALFSLALLFAFAACTKEALVGPKGTTDPDCGFPLLNNGGEVPAGRDGWVPTEPHLED